MDIYPTLTDLAGLGLLQGPQPIDGLSMVPVLEKPELQIRDHAYHCFARGGYMGRAIRTERYRLVGWVRINNPDDERLMSILPTHPEAKNPAPRSK